MSINSWPVLYQIVLPLDENPGVHQFPAPLWPLASDLVLILVFVSVSCFSWSHKLRGWALGPRLGVGLLPGQSPGGRPAGQCALGFGGLGGAGHGSAVAGSLPLMSTCLQKSLSASIFALLLWWKTCFLYQITF